MSLFSKSKWLLATQWDSVTLQYVLARQQPNGDLKLVSARSLEHSGEIEYIAELLKSEMDKHNVRKPDVLVTLPRSKADVIQMELPPSTDVELTNLVPLQAMQQVGDLGEDSMLDYLPLNADPGSANSNSDAKADSSVARRVLAINPQTAEIERIREILTAADLAQPSRISFRPLAPLPLAKTIVPIQTGTSPESTKGRTLFIALQDQHADMLLMEGQQLLLNRSIRLPQPSDEVFVETLVDEIRRTDLVAPASESISASATDEISSEPSVGQILAFGGSDEQDTWSAVEQLAEVPVQIVNPLEYLPAEKQFAVRRSGRFAPLIGTLLEHSNPSTSTIDFLTPRRPVTPPSLVKRFGIYAVAVASAVAICGYFIYEQRINAESQIAELSDQLALEEKIGDKLQRRQKIAQAVQQWKSDDVNCLDELLDLSKRLPGPTDAFIQRLTIAPVKGGKSVIMQVRVRDQQLVKELESNLRDTHHRVTTKPVSEISADEEFGWQFDATVLVAPRSADAYRNAFAIPAATTSPNDSSPSDDSNSTGESNPSPTTTDDAINGAPNQDQQQ